MMSLRRPRISTMTSALQTSAVATEITPPVSSSSPSQGLIIPTDNQDLNNEITRLAGHINAAQYRFLKLLAALIERSAWGGDSGIKSPAHWLNYYCGIALGAAREKVRVAQCLNSLPLIDKAFQTGAISYSKVRAMTRSATPENEEFLLRIARVGTAQHVENLIRKYRRVERLNPASEDAGEYKYAKSENQHQARAFSSYYDDDGMLVFRGKLAPEEGAVFLKALEIVLNHLDEKGVPAGTPLVPDVVFEPRSEVVGGGEAGTTVGKDSHAQKRADALVLMAEHALEAAQNMPGTALSGGDKYQVVVHIEVKSDQAEEAGTNPHTHTHAWLGNGPALCPETVRRLACHASLVTVLEDSTTKVLNVGRKTRTIPPAIRRALTIRDQGCRVPGCTQSRYVDAHHIQHWCDGGETSLDNLVLLCRHHHRLLHQGAFLIENRPKNEHSHQSEEKGIVFMRADGQVISQSLYPQFSQPDIRADGGLEIEIEHKALGLDIIAGTAVCTWQGESMDYGLAVAAMLAHR